MKARRRALRLIAAITLLFGAVAGLHAWFTPRLPHFELPAGGAMRVLEVRFYEAGGSTHDFMRAPQWKIRVWEAMPKRLQLLIPYPQEGLHGVYSPSPAISIWFDWKHLPTDNPEAIHGDRSLGVRVDGGKFLRGKWTTAAHEYSEMLIEDPPRDARSLHVEVFDPWKSLTGDTLCFTIDNPAYRQP